MSKMINPNSKKEQSLIFCLPVEGSPYLYKSVDEDDTATIVKTVNEAIEGHFEKLSLNMIKTMAIIIHPMFKMENEKWAFAERLLFNQTAVVYISEEGDRCGNVATIIKNKRYQVGGCPHLMGHIIIRISETEYKKMSDKPLYYWDNEEESDDEEEEEEETERKITGDCCLCDGRYTFYGNNAQPLADGQCCNDCNDRVINARLGFKLSEVPATTGFMCIDIRNKNEFYFYGGKFIAHYNEDGYLKTAEYWSKRQDGGYKQNKIPEGAILVHKIDDDDGCAYIKLVKNDYVLVGDENIVCDYDRDWFGVE